MRQFFQLSRIRTAFLILLGLPLLFWYVNCSSKLTTDGTVISSSKDDDTASTLWVSPQLQTALPNSTVQFRAGGGTAPYQYAITSGGGSINAATGLYTAPSAPQSVSIRVTDAEAKSVIATVMVSTSGGQTPGANLSISFSSNPVYLGKTTSIQASGGAGGYQYFLDSYGMGVITGNTFTAGSVTGNATIRVMDASGAVSVAVLSVQVEPDPLTPIYRLYQHTHGFHLFSLAPNEGAEVGYVSEGVRFKLVAVQVPNSKAIYRCYREGVPHFMTDASNCHGIANLEFQMGFIYTTQVAGSVPLYRFFNPANHSRFCTIDLNEGNAAGFKLEGQLGFVMPP